MNNIEHSLLYRMLYGYQSICLASKIHHHKAEPAAHNAHRRIRTRKHERHKLVSVQTKNNLMDERAVQYQRDTDSDIQE